MINIKIEEEMQLFKVTLANNIDCYVVAEDESEARDKVREWSRERFMYYVQILDIDLVAETESKGFVDKLVI